MIIIIMIMIIIIMIIILLLLLLLLASERSERDTYRGNTIENRGCLFIYLFVYMYGRT